MELLLVGTLGVLEFLVFLVNDLLRVSDHFFFFFFFLLFLTGIRVPMACA